MVDRLLLVLPLLTAIGCFVVVFDRKHQPYTRFYFLLTGATLLWLFIGEFSAQYAGWAFLRDRVIRATPFRLIAFIATWCFVLGAKGRSDP